MGADARDEIGRRPEPVIVLRIALLLFAGSLVFLGATAFVATPVQSVQNLAGAVAGLIGAVSAHRALGRSERWAAWYAIAVLAALVALGFWHMAWPSTPSRLVIPAGAIIAGIVLLWLRRRWPEV